MAAHRLPYWLQRGCRPTKTARCRLRVEAEAEAQQAVDGLHKVFIKNFCNGTKNCQLTNWHPRKQHKLLGRPYPSCDLLWSVAACAVVVVVAVSATATDCRTKIAVNFEEGIKNKLTIFCARFATVHTHSYICIQTCICATANTHADTYTNTPCFSCWKAFAFSLPSAIRGMQCHTTPPLSSALVGPWVTHNDEFCG